MRRFLISLGRVFSTGAKNFIRNSWLSTAATAIMFVTLIVVTMTFIANMTFTEAIKNLTAKIDISVYLKDGVKPADRERFITQLRSQPNVRQVEYKSKEDALALYREENKNDLELLNAVSLADNPLPATITIQTKDPNKIQDIAAIIAQTQNLALQSDDPSYSGDRKQAIDRIISLADFLRNSGIVASVVFAVISTLIIFNTIRMAIFNRRDEIEIMKLIGASRWYIRGPFLVEASMYGIIAGVVTVVFTAVLLDTQAANIAQYIPEIMYTKNYIIGHEILIAVAVVAVGVFIGIASAMLATKRYLKMHTAKRSRRRLRKGM